MAFVLSEEQIMIQTMARDFAREVVMPGAAERDRSHQFPGDILREMGELGFMGMMVPDTYGGAGVDLLFAVAFLEEIGCSVNRMEGDVVAG